MNFNYKLSMILLLLWAGIAQAQSYDLNNFTPLKSVGPLPDDFTVKSSEKFQQDVSNVEGSNKREQQDLESFLLESNFQIEDILHSGRILYGDPITEYLNQIKKQILDANPEIMQDIRIYTLLSNEVNAFTFDNGIVIVTPGWLHRCRMKRSWPIFFVMNLCITIRNILLPAM
jgi:predicted Zn-dependent protease